jgi:MFS family permease
MFENSKGHAATRSLMQLLFEVISSHRGEIAPQRFRRALGASLVGLALGPVAGDVIVQHRSLDSLAWASVFACLLALGIVLLAAVGDGARARFSLRRSET